MLMDFAKGTKEGGGIEAYFKDIKAEPIVKPQNM